MALPEEKPTSKTGNTAPAGELPLPEAKKRSIFSRIFSPVHRFGRFVRALGIALAVVVIFLGLGALAVWYFQLRPLQQQYRALEASATQTAADLQLSREKLAEANQGLTSARGEAVDVQTSLTVEQERVQVLRIMLALNESRMAVMNDDVPGAKKALATAQENLEKLVAQMEKVDEQQAKTLQTLFSLAKDDLERNSNLFIQDIIRLNSELELVEQSIEQ